MPAEARKRGGRASGAPAPPFSSSDQREFWRCAGFALLTNGRDPETQDRSRKCRSAGRAGVKSRDCFRPEHPAKPKVPSVSWRPISDDLIGEAAAKNDNSTWLSHRSATPVLRYRAFHRPHCSSAFKPGGNALAAFVFHSVETAMMARHHTRPQLALSHDIFPNNRPSSFSYIFPSTILQLHTAPILNNITPASISS